MHLSVIMPVYNGEHYIVEAIDSFFKQYQSKIELIVVDDGSTDYTFKVVCENYKEHIESESLILVQQSNAGVSAARNVALGIAKGKYVTFLDADDILLDGYTKHIIDAINSQDADVIEFGFRTFINADNIKNSEDQFVHERFGLIDFNTIKNDVYERSIWYPCIRAFRRSLFNNLSFPEGIRFCEDMMLLTKIYEKVETVFHIGRALYGYRINMSGATMNIRPDYYYNLLNFYQSLPRENSKHLDYMRINLAYLLYKCHIGESLPILLRVDFLKLFAKYVFDKRLNLRKKIILGFPNTHRNLKRFLKQ